MRHAGLRLAIHFDETARAGRQLLSDVLGDVYETHGVQAAVLLRAVEGFGVRGLLHTDRLVDTAPSLSLVSIAVDTTSTIQRVLADARDQLTSGLLTLEPTSLLTDGLGASDTVDLPDDDVKLTLYLGRRPSAGQLGFARAVELLHQQGVPGATVLLGLDGMTHGRRARGRFFSANAGVPVLVTAIGSRRQIQHALAKLDRELDRPLATMERVQTWKRDGTMLGPPTPIPGGAREGAVSWQRFTIFAAGDARHEQRPLGSELVHRLSRSGASGATLFRGVWGSSGDHPPHGERVWSVRRQAPTVTTVICPPQELATTWSILDELTSRHGLVISEPVAAVHVGSTVQTDEPRPARFPPGPSPLGRLPAWLLP